MSRPIVVLTGAHRPHEQLLLAVSLGWGAACLLGAPPPGSVVTLLPRWEVVAWTVLLLVSGVVGLVGCWWRGHIATGLGLELAGMLFGAGATIVYVTGVVAATGVRGLFPAVIVAAWSAANLWRAAQIRGHLRHLQTGDHS